MRNRQLELLRKLGDAQELVPDGGHNDFLTASSFDGTDIVLPSGENVPFNRQDLDELIDRGFVRVTRIRKHGDLNRHVTNAGFEQIESLGKEDTQRPSAISGPQPLFEGPRDVPIAFISFSHDSEEHKAWVRVKLAERLMAAGIRVILDQWHRRYGSDLTHFMEQATRADFVLVVCTPAYAERPNERRGGVGYETSVITADLLAHRPSVKLKVVLILREGEFETALPVFLKATIAAALRQTNRHSEDDFRRLLKELHREPEFVPPPLGPKPSFGSN